MIGAGIDFHRHRVSGGLCALGQHAAMLCGRPIVFLADENEQRRDA
jgi:hypothetical protein